MKDCGVHSDSVPDCLDETSQVGFHLVISPSQTSPVIDMIGCTVSWLYDNQSYAMNYCLRLLEQQWHWRLAGLYRESFCTAILNRRTAFDARVSIDREPKK